MATTKHSAPPYQHGTRHHHSRPKHSELMSNRTFSTFPPEKMLQYYRWTSPPGVMKIISIIIIIMCVAIFACVASTFAWDYDMGGLVPGLGYGGSYGGSYGGAYGSGGSYGGSYGGAGSYGSGSYGGGYGYGMQMDPVAGKAFMVTMAALTFLAALVIFVLVISRQSTARSPKFYLAAIIICAILAFLVIIATIVYSVAVNPTAQSSGSVYYNQIVQLCAQYQTETQAQGIFINQYMYHYCVVDPQEIIAIVLGFLVFVGLIILLVFAVKTRNQMRRWGPHRILWDEIKVINVAHTSVGEWVNNVSGRPDILLNQHNDQVGGSRDYLDQLESNKPLYLPGDSDISSSMGGLKPKQWIRDYDTGAESGDDLEEEDFSHLFPSIVDEQERLNYKREFDQDHKEYKNLQRELDGVNQDLAQVDRELELYPSGSPQFLDALNKYNKLKNMKKTSDYQSKKRRSRYLRSKLSHIKRKVSEYDRRP